MLDEPRRSQLSAFISRAGSESLGLISLARKMATGDEDPNLPFLLSSYVRGVGSFYDHLQHEIRQEIDAVGRRCGVTAPAESLFDEYSGVRRTVLASFCPDLIDAPYTIRSNEGLEQIPLLEPCPNELADNTIPPPMNMLLHHTHRPPLRAYATHDAVLYAHPFRHQVLSKDKTALWASGSPRSLTRAAIGEANSSVTISTDIIVLQDRFHYTNFSHFLFDAMPRALLLSEHLGSLRSSLLVFGGLPGAYHAAVCQALIDVLRIDRSNIYFPDAAVILETSGRCIWFSDQVETYLHPAQMAHPLSVNLLRSVVEKVPGAASGTRRVYVSRADAEQRRVVNETQVCDRLRARGFTMVQLSKLSVAQQVGLFRDAEIVVAPHGMGMTHIAAADRLKGVVELFSPAIGTDAYAFMAKAGGIAYHCVVGRAVDSPVADFEVGHEQIDQCLDTLDATDGRPSWRKPANLLIGSKSFSMFRAAKGCISGLPPIPELIWGSRVFAHQAGAAAERGDTIAGGWTEVPTIAGCRYTASCFVWLPEGYSSSGVALSLRGCSGVEIVGADHSRCGQWQRIWTTGIASSASCDVELRIAALPGTALFSTCWQLERGARPTSYVATAGPSAARTAEPAPVIATLLTAPEDPPAPEDAGAAGSHGGATAWYAIEQAGPLRFRWTAGERVEWPQIRPPAEYPCTVKFVIPVAAEISPDFAGRCRLLVDSRAYDVKREQGAISATVDLDRPWREPIALLTPPPLRPFDLSGSPDQRPLGLAIPLAQ